MEFDANFLLISSLGDQNMASIIMQALFIGVTIFSATLIILAYRHMRRLEQLFPDVIKSARTTSFSDLESSEETRPPQVFYKYNKTIFPLYWYHC